MKVKEHFVSNKMRYIYFFGFCAVFSLDKLYDSNFYFMLVIILENSVFKKT